MKKLCQIALLAIIGIAVACNDNVQEDTPPDGTGATTGGGSPTAGSGGQQDGTGATSGGGSPTAGSGGQQDGTGTATGGGSPTAGSGASGGSTASGGPPTGPCEGLAGRYVLTLNGMEADVQTQTHLALDEDGDDCKATLSDPWGYGDPRSHVASSPVTLTPERLTLDPLVFNLYPDPAAVDRGVDGMELNELRLPRQPDGALAGTAVGTGQLYSHVAQYCEDPCNHDGCPPFEGTVIPAPDLIELRLGVQEPEVYNLFGAACTEFFDFSTVLPSQALPWDRLAVASSWPAPGLVAALGTPHLDETVSAVAFGGWQEADEPGGAPWTWLQDWDAVGGSTIVVPLMAASLPADVAPSQLALTFVEAPPAGAGPYEFDELPESVLTFGDVTIENGRAILDGGEALAGRMDTAGASRLYVEIAGGDDALAGLRVVGRSSGPRRVPGERKYGGGLFAVELQGDDEAAFTIASAPESGSGYQVEIERIWAE